MLKMIKIGCFKLFYAKLVSQVRLKALRQYFLLNSGARRVVVTSFTHIHSGLPQIYFSKFQQLENAQIA